MSQTESGVRPAGMQRYIIRQTAIKCATDLVVGRQVKIEDLFKFSGRIVAWIYSTPKEPDGKAPELEAASAGEDKS